MKFAFILYKYFPFGGLQRDFLRIAKACQDMGHTIVVYTMGWDGECPEGFEIHTHKPSAMSAPKRNTRFQHWVQQQIEANPVDIVVGFNKMPGLDVYYAADTCFEHKARHLRKSWYKYTPRYRHFSFNEDAVFNANNHTVSLLISANEKVLFQKYYQTQEERLHLLPPGISRDRRRPENADEIRAEFRTEFGIKDDEHLVLMVGSGFKTKGVDRALQALKGLSLAVRAKTKLFIVGQDDPRLFRAQAQSLGINSQVTFFSGRDDIPRFLVGADMLIHPAYNENTGTVLLEALVAGLPVLCTEVCGYAHYITDAQAGDVVPSPFHQEDLNRRLETMLTSNNQKQWQANALSFADTADIYSMPERAAAIIEQTAESLTQSGVTR
ncbi:glycosyltransferase family 4 protein [Parendozoicomonas haliclonae]|uniref:Lipopolysaccharide core biosynthesis protein RfaG n=1 Tax=Parendozoicomonas haliclonae TaxID=1960125 RepID=A0A1X7AIT6_9GAMM|nr:glycosyltransferase family 4 protein [Parendozoicomonas haliclonae]SMA45735.1 Lipopolysaccharide core biosynthesis protein RfaG [Parendozoicomonas haliclonae]